MEGSRIAKVRRRFGFQTKPTQFLLCAFLILLYYHIHIGLFILNPFCFAWILNNDELAVLYFGWDFYHAEPWTFPIGMIQNYFYPIGTNIYMTDIPLMALALKPFSAILPDHFQYVGIWLITCHLLQAWFAILLCERFGIQGFRRVIVSLFIIFCPVYLIRFQHATLFAHWMILASFLIYFMDPHTMSVRRIIFYQLILIVLSSLLMLYLWLIVFGFSVALFLRLWLADKKIKYYHAFLLMIGQVLLVFLIWVCVGLISLGSLPDYQSNGWGEFSMNLNAFFNPFGMSSLLPSMPFFPMQALEGYAYLGAGVLLLCLLLVGIHLLKFIPSTRLIVPPSALSFSFQGINMIPLILFITASFAYSLSCNISFNQQILFHYELKGFLLKMANSFRASGRLSWIIYYSILFLLFYKINKIHIKTPVVNSVLLFCFALQVVDLKLFFLPATKNCEKYIPSISPNWEKLIQTFDNIIFYPGFARTYLTYDDYRYFSYYAGKYHKKINIGYVARYDVAKMALYTDTLNKNLHKKGLDDQTLYITLPPYVNRLLQPIEDQSANILNIGGYIAVFKKTADHERVFTEISASEGPDSQRKISWHPVRTNASSSFQVTERIKSALYEKDDSPDHFYIKGWAFSEESSDNLHDSVSIILASRDRKFWTVPAYRFSTEDVANHFNNPLLNRSGFGMTLLKRALPKGSYRVGLQLTNSLTGYHGIRWIDSDFTVLEKLHLDEIAKIPESSGEIKLSVEITQEDENEIRIAGWAYPVGGICRTCSNFLILSSAEKNYSLEFISNPRPDVVTFMNDTSLLYSGVTLNLIKKDFSAGTYNVGILMHDSISKINYYTLTSILIKTGAENFAHTSLLKELPRGTENIRAYIDKIEDKRTSLEIYGWAFIDQVNSDQSSCSLALRSGEKYYEVAVDRTYRKDLKEYFKLSYSVDLAGITAKIKKMDLPEGNYQVCVIMFNKLNQQKTLTCLDNFVEITPH